MIKYIFYKITKSKEVIIIITIIIFFFLLNYNFLFVY